MGAQLSINNGLVKTMNDMFLTSECRREFKI